MTDPSIVLARENERLRQERETFDQAKSQNAQWARVRLAMGWVAVFVLPAVLIVASLIIFFHKDFSAATVAVAAGALLVDSLATAGSLYKLVIANQPKAELKPVIQVVSLEDSSLSPPDKLRADGADTSG